MEWGKMLKNRMSFSLVAIYVLRAWKPIPRQVTYMKEWEQAGMVGTGGPCIITSDTQIKAIVAMSCQDCVCRNSVEYCSCESYLDYS
jgi:hypothetical protein